MKIAIRLDDITENMDWCKFNKMKDILDRYGICPLIGVVPDNKDPLLEGNFVDDTAGRPGNFGEYINSLKEKGWVVAMHGFDHVYTTTKGGIFPLNNFSEFAGLPYDEQLEMISYGKQILEEKDIHTDIFMAPGHSYDMNTLKALKECGIAKITDGFGDKPYSYADVTFYPISFRKSTTLKSRKDGYSTFVYHTTTMKDEDFESFERMLSQNDFISYSEYLNAPVVKRSRRGMIREYVLAMIKRLLVRL